MPKVKITQGDSAGEVCECDEAKAARLIAAGVAEATDDKVTDGAPKSHPSKTNDEPSKPPKK